MRHSLPGGGPMTVWMGPSRRHAIKLNGPSFIPQIERYRQQQYGCKKYNFCIIVLRGTLKSGTRDKIIIKNFNGRRRCAMKFACCVLLSDRAITETFKTPLVPQMLVRPGCLRTSCAVKGLLINLTSSSELELASFVALPCSERNCVFDTPRF